jgi:hypothetical protein
MVAITVESPIQEKTMNKIINTVFAATLVLTSAPMAQAALYTATFGTLIPTLSDCDDCAAGPFVFGAGQTINFFGTTYSGLFVSSNGYVTFDGPHTVFTDEPITTQTVGPMIAGLATDLDTTGDPNSNIYVNTLTTGEIIVTYDMVAHALDPTMLSTFQLVIRSDQKAIPAGEGQLGFFYGDITDTHLVSAGFGDGLAAINPGEVSFASQVPGTDLSNNLPRWFTLNGGPVEPPPTGVSEPSSLALLALGIAAVFALNRRRRA